MRSFEAVFVGFVFGLPETNVFLAYKYLFPSDYGGSVLGFVPTHLLSMHDDLAVVQEDLIHLHVFDSLRKPILRANVLS